MSGDAAGMDRSRSMERHPLIVQLDDALALESKFQPNLRLPVSAQNPSDITAGMRDGSAHVLRCLKVWYDLDSDVLFVAINLMDRFLSKMKALPKHLACIAVSAFHLAAQHVKRDSRLDPQDLVSISQCNCTMGDLGRMENIVSDKLACEPGSLPITSLTFLRVFLQLFSIAAENLGPSASEVFQQIVANCAEQRLEIVVCDACYSNFRPSEIALALLYAQLDGCVTSGDAASKDCMKLVCFVLELAKHCKISDGSFMQCHEVVLSLLARYDAQCQVPHRQRLVWRLSQRTLRYLRPTDKLTSTLPTINEHGQLQTRKRKEYGRLQMTKCTEFEDDGKTKTSVSPKQKTWSSWNHRYLCDGMCQGRAA